MAAPTRAFRPTSAGAQRALVSIRPGPHQPPTKTTKQDDVKTTSDDTSPLPLHPSPHLPLRISLPSSRSAIAIPARWVSSGSQTTLLGMQVLFLSRTFNLVRKCRRCRGGQGPWSTLDPPLKDRD
uniref:Uncharacterized protein n=1 Tax=Coccidioides posadasii RMSCC 3488 TaxID=454284 RepID=A0A0J6F660_COCPO|nr:hypothetical protein CPAG_00791 [Coccidioides posadasii RMSCC 3488]